MYIIHKGFSGMRSTVSRSKFSNGGYRRSPQSLTKSYTQRCVLLENSGNTEIIRKRLCHIR